MGSDVLPLAPIKTLDACIKQEPTVSTVKIESDRVESGVKKEEQPDSRSHICGGVSVLPGVARRLLGLPIMKLMYEFKGNMLVEETSVNGGGKVAHVYPDNWIELTESEQTEFVSRCYDFVFHESAPGSPDYVMGIVHSGAADMPNILRFLNDRYPQTPVSVEPFGQKHSCQVVPLHSFVEQVDRTYQAGTHRAGTMRNISLVGCQQEERGGYFEDVLRLLEAHPFLRDVLPWGPRAMYDHLDPGDSDDGPIMWCCPGEQVVPLQELSSAAGGTGGAAPTPAKKRNPLERLHILPRNEKPREKLVEDRTGAHADMAGLFPFRHPVAAAGFVQGATEDAQGRELKDIIAFHGADMDLVTQACGLYLHEEPKDQLLDPQLWIDEAKLNQLSRQGVRYARIRLVGGDVYFIPRKVVHQFRTIGACISVTWHLKHRDYYHDKQPTETISAAGTIGKSDEVTGSASEAERGASPAPQRPVKKLQKAAAIRRAVHGDRPKNTASASPRKAPSKAPRRRKRRDSDEDDESSESSDDDFGSSSDEEVVRRPPAKRAKRIAPHKAPLKELKADDLGDDFLLEDSSELESDSD